MKFEKICGMSKNINRHISILSTTTSISTPLFVKLYSYVPEHILSVLRGILSLYECFMKFQYLSKYVLIEIPVIQKLSLYVVFTAKCYHIFCWYKQNKCKTFLHNLWTPNDHYSGRTASLTSKRCLLYIYSTNIGTEYFKQGIYSPCFPLQNTVFFS